MINQYRVRYLLVGCLNTLIGYAIGVGMYKSFESILGIIWIGIFSNILSISFSFITYKIFVFKTKDMWLEEYLKAYLVYGGVAIIGTISLWVFVGIMNISIWTAQALTIGIAVIFSYVGHSRFTFQRKEI